MDLFVLQASLGLDVSKYESGISKAKKLLVEFATTVEEFGEDVVKTGMGFDKQMSAVQAVMGLTENTTKNLATMNNLREFALEQARDSIFTAEETATAYYYMGMAGWRAEQMISGLPGIMALAAASGENLKMTSDMVTDSLTAFGLGAGQATHFADVLAVTATNANTDVARMQQTFKNLAPIAGALGYSIEDVALSVGLIANSGIKGSQAGTALRNIFTRIATDAGATSKTLGALQIVTDELGVSFYTAEGRARPWGEVLADMRAAWRKLNPDQVDKVTAAFGKFSAESQSADEIMSEFADDLDTWTTEWNGLTSAVDRENFVANLEPQFAALGVSMRDSNGQLREFSEVAKDVRVKLGGLTDQEQIYYGKQIGSLRGISGLLALMTSSEADVRQLTNAIENADGAAQAMADTRLDNLWGDTARFNAELDVLKIALYDDVKSPLRDVVQYGTSALKNITDAIEKDGLIGGIKQLSTELHKLADDYKDELKTLGESIVPVIAELFGPLVVALADVAVTLGGKFGKGLVEGIIENLPGWAYRILGIKEGETAPTSEVYELSLKGVVTEIEEPDVKNYGGVEIPVDVIADVDIDILKSNIEYAMSHGGMDIEIGDGFVIGVEAAQRLVEDLENVGVVGGNALAQNVYNALDEASQLAENALSIDIGNAGADGGSSMASNVLSAVEQEGSNITNSLYNSLSEAGSDAGTSVSNSIKNKLKGTNFVVNVAGAISGFINKIHKNASAMADGQIYNTPTIFGYAKGAYQVAGDAGPEAVVGVSSLRRMIQDAVSHATPRFGDGGITFQIYQQPTQSAEELAEVIQREFVRIEKQRMAYSS